MAALDMALWDLAGKAARKPIYELLGGAVQKQVMAYASATLFTVARDGSWMKKSTKDLVRECCWCLERGFKAIKYGWGNCFEREDEENLAAMREAVGPKIRLMIDVGCPAYWEEGWNARSAIRVARILEKYGVYFLEEALRPDDVVGFAKLSKAVRIRIASGESLTTTFQFDPIIDTRALDVIQPDAQQMGITQFHQVAKKAEKTGILCVPHGPWTAMCVAAHIHLLATLKTGDMIEYPCMESLGWSKRTFDEVSLNNFEIVEKPPVLRDGYLQLPSGPGLGAGRFVPSALKKLDRMYPAKR
jgi:D-galactarolactone cycloisomerase